MYIDLNFKCMTQINFDAVYLHMVKTNVLEIKIVLFLYELNNIQKIYRENKLY